MDLGGGEGSKNNSRRISSVQYGPFESLLLQYTLTKIESHFISIQQQQKNSFLDCYTANVFQRLLFTITVAKREGGMRPGGGGAGGSETMRAPRAGRGAVRSGRSWRRAGGGPGGKKGGRPSDLLFPLPPSHTTPMSTPLGMCTCKEERVPSLTLVPGCKGLRSSDTPGCRRRLLLSHLPLPVRFSLHFVASFAGLVSAEGRGAIALYILEKTLGKGGGPTHPLPQPSAPPQPSAHGSVSLLLCFTGGPTSDPSPTAPDPQAAFQPQCSLGQHLHTLEAQLT